MHSYPWYIADWRSSECVGRMDAAQRGLYRELLDYCWEWGTIPNDGPFMARKMGLEWTEIASIWHSVAMEFHQTEDGRLSHRKVDQKRAQVIDLKAKRSAAGKEGGKGKSKASKQNESNLLKQNESKPNTLRARTPSPSLPPSPSPSVAAAAATAAAATEPEPKNKPRPDFPELGPDWQGEVWNATNKLLKMYADAGLSGGDPASARAQGEKILAEEGDPAKALAAWEPAMALCVRHWLAAKADALAAGRRSPFVPQLAKWFRDGDWARPPKVVARAAAPVVREFDRALVPK